MFSAVKTYLTYCILITFSITSLIHITPGLRMSVSLADLLIPLLGLVWLADIRRFSLKAHFPHSWYFLALLALLLVSNLYNLHAGTPSSGGMGMASEGVKIIVNGAFFFAAYNAPTARRDGDGLDVKGVCLAWLAGLHVFIAYGLYAHFTWIAGGTPWVFNQSLQNHSRFIGTLTDPNAAALYLSVSFFVVVMARRYVFTSRRARAGLLVLGAAALLCVLFTYSRGGWVGLAGALAVWAAGNMKTQYKKYIAAIPLLIGLFFAGRWADTQFLSGYVGRNITVRAQNAMDERGMLYTRWHLSLASVRMGLDHPVIGVGRGNFPLNSEAYLLEQGVSYNERLFKNTIPHNTIAGFFAEMGVLGAGVFVSLFALMAVKIYRSPYFDRAFKVLALALWVGVLIQSLSISLENARALWVMAGLTLCLAGEGDAAWKTKTPVAL